MSLVRRKPSRPVQAVETYQPCSDLGPKRGPSAALDFVTWSACVQKPARPLLGSRAHRGWSRVDLIVELRACAVRFLRLALDLVLADEPECEHRTGQAEEAREGEHVVESGEEALVRGVGCDRPGALWKRRE